jgi:hypothetical protein
MKWQKLGLVFGATGEREWMRSHASAPLALSLGGDRYRVYFATRDDCNRSHIGFVEFDLNNPQEIFNVAREPVLAPGPLGHFDDHGVFASSIIAHEKRLLLYYIGFCPGVRRPLYYASIGLAQSDDGGRSFRKPFAAPIMSRSEYDPCLVTGPSVMLDNGIWRMWYVSGFKWLEEAGELHSYYHIKYAESEDGMQWQRNGVVCIDLRPGERNISRPCVVKEGDGYRMWYSYNVGQGYRIGYAESPDGYVWIRRDDEAGIEVSDAGWDSKALAYPYVINHQGTKYMFYNGNEFGKDGFGLARWTTSNV